jgi:hypothetical protein
MHRYFWNGVRMPKPTRDNPKKCVIVNEIFRLPVFVSKDTASTRPTYLSIEWPESVTDIPYISHVIAM